VLAPPATGHSWDTVADLFDAYERSREFCRLAPRTRTDYLKGPADVRARYGATPLGIINSVALKGNVLDWIEARWNGKVADLRLNAFKFALSWASFRHPERVAVNYLNGIRCFYRGTSRAEIIWEDAEVELFCRLAPEPFADAVRLARETGLRIGDLVELERSEIKGAPGGGRAIVLRPNKRRNRIVNMPLTASAEAIVDKAPHSRRLILRPLRANAWGAVRLSREVRDYATEFGIRRELRFNDLRGTKVTELVWAGTSVPELAVRMGWGRETAAKMAGVYAALNPGRGAVETLPATAMSETAVY
jgi:integrase